MSFKWQNYLKLEVQTFKNGKIHDFSTFEVNYLKNYGRLRKTEVIFEISAKKRLRFVCHQTGEFFSADQCNSQVNSISVNIFQ